MDDFPCNVNIGSECLSQINFAKKLKIFSGVPLTAELNPYTGGKKSKIHKRANY